MRSLHFPVAIAATLLVAACATAPRSAINSAPQPVASADVATAPFVGSVKSHKYYPRGCHTLKLIAAKDLVAFQSLKDAEAAGYTRDLMSTDCQ